MLGVIAFSATRGSRLTPRQKLLLGTGLCGGFTTFSTFAVDVVALWGAGKVGTAAALVTASNGGAILAVATAARLARR